MNKSFNGALCAGVFTLGLAASADAALLSRLGGQAVYDTDLNITWLADANAGAGSAFDDGLSNSDGQMAFNNANAWVASLTVGGFNDWRLPTGNLTCGGFSPCPNSELGHLFYDELGGTVGVPIINSGDPDLGLFTNIQSTNEFSGYWTSTEDAFDLVLYFTLKQGFQGLTGKGNQWSAWAVRDGDVGVVSEPSIFALLGIGLLGFMRRNRNRQ